MPNDYIILETIAIFQGVFIMKNFFQWAEEHAPDLGDLLVSGEGEDATSENRIRTGLKFGYPDAYARAQYPNQYFPPYSATAPVDLKNNKRSK